MTERQQPPDTRAPYAVANVVAARDGVLTEVSVTEGMRLCAVGDTVRQGQLLVSGYEDYGLFIRPVCASAEIYARTWHTGTVVTPAERLEKRYTGREWKQVTLIVGKKRIKLWGNSSISQQDCDKMIVEKAVRTSGYAYPLRLETAILREYVLEPAPAPQVQTEKLLQEAWRRAVQAQMLAGMESTIKVRVGGFLLTGVVFGSSLFTIGAEVPLSVTGDQIMLFDRKSGQCITSGSLTF